MKKIMFNNRYGLTQAVLDLLKTMTRRIISEKEWDKIRKFKEEYYEQTFDRLEDKELIKTYFDTYPERMPYQVGEVVAIAQSYKDAKIEFIPIEESVLLGKKSEARKWGYTKSMAGYHNKMFVCADLMPHHIRITDIKGERLQDISDDDCIAEGIICKWHAPACRNYYYVPNETINHPDKVHETPQEAYASLIDKVSGKGVWDSNPWVLAYEFELVK